MTTLTDNNINVDRVSRSVSPQTSWSEIELSRIAPPPRSGATFNYINNKGYLFGGRTETEYSAELHIYDPLKNTWYYSKCFGDLPTGRRGHSCIAIDNMLLLFGGENKVSCSNELFLFDPSQDRWKTLVTTGEPPSPRYGQGMVFVNGKNVLVFGGISRISGQRIHHNDLYSLDLEKLNWTRCEFDFSQGCPMERYGHSFVSINGKILCYGGFSSNGRLRDIWELTFIDGGESSWSRISSVNRHEPSPRTEHLTFVIGKYLIIFGGSLPTSTANDLWAFDTESLHWQCLNNGTESPPPRFSAAGFLYDTNMIVFGGRDKIPHADMWKCKLSIFSESVSQTPVETPDKKSVQKLHNAIGSTKASLQIDDDAMSKIEELLIDPLKDEIHNLKKHIDSTKSSYNSSIDENNSRYTVINEKYDRSLSEFQTQLKNVAADGEDTRTILDQFIAKTQSDILNDNASLSTDISRLQKEVNSTIEKTNEIEHELQDLKKTDPMLSVENIQNILYALDKLSSEDERIEALVKSGLDAIRSESAGRIASAQSLEKMLVEHSTSVKSNMVAIADCVQDLCTRVSALERGSGLDPSCDYYESILSLAPAKSRRPNTYFSSPIQDKINEFIQQSTSVDYKLMNQTQAIEGLQFALRNFATSTQYKIRNIEEIVSQPVPEIDIESIESKISDANEMIDLRFNDLSSLIRAEAETRIRDNFELKKAVKTKSEASLTEALEAKLNEIDLELHSIRSQYIENISSKIDTFDNDFQRLESKTEEASQTASELSRSAVTQIELDMTETKLIEKYTDLARTIEDLKTRFKPSPMMSFPPSTPKKVSAEPKECPPSVNLLEKEEHEKSDSFFDE